MLAETSLLAYEDLKRTYKLDNRQLQVLEKINSVPKLTAYEYAKFCFCIDDPNFVRPRITELHKLGAIEIAGKRKCSITKKMCYVWEVV